MKSDSSLATHSKIPLELKTESKTTSTTVPTVKAEVPFLTLQVVTDAGAAGLSFIGVNAVPVAPAADALVILTLIGTSWAVP